MLRADTGDAYSDVPVIAVRGEADGRRVEAVGENALALGGGSIKLINPFTHPRVFVADPEVATALVRCAVTTVMKRRTMWRPMIIVHPLHTFGTQLSAIEQNALLEIAFASGAMGAAVHEGPELSVRDVMSFPTGLLVPAPRAPRW